MPRSSRNYALVLLAGLVVMIIWHFQADRYTVSSVYQSDAHGFEIMYPNSWEVVTQPVLPEETTARFEDVGKYFAVAFVSPDHGHGFRQNVTVAVYPREADDPTDAALFEDFLEGIEEIGSKFEMMEQASAVLNGRPGRMAIYRMRVRAPGIRSMYVRYMTYLIPVDDQLYAVTCTDASMSFDNHVDVFDQVIDSFRIES